MDNQNERIAGQPTDVLLTTATGAAVTGASGRTVSGGEVSSAPTRRKVSLGNDELAELEAVVRDMNRVGLQIAVRLDHIHEQLQEMIRFSEQVRRIEEPAQ